MNSAEIAVPVWTTLTEPKLDFSFVSGLCRDFFDVPELRFLEDFFFFGILYSLTFGVRFCQT